MYFLTAPPIPKISEIVHKLEGQIGFIVYARRWMMERFFLPGLIATVG